MIENQNIRNILATTEFMMPSFTNAEKRAAEYVIAHPNEVEEMSLKEFAAACGSGEATVMRMCRATGAKGFTEYKQMLKVINANPVELETTVNMPQTDSMAQILESIFNINILNLKRTLEVASLESYKAACDAVAGCRRICFFAIGDAMFACNYAILKFRRVGYECYGDSDPDIQIVNALNMVPGDVAIVVSHSGKTKQVVRAAQIAKNNGAYLICITKSGRSPLTRYSDTVLYTETADTTIDKEIVARRVAEQAILDVIYMGVIRRTNVDEKLQGVAVELSHNKIDEN